MDPLRVSSSLIAATSLSQRVISLLDAIKDRSKDKSRLMVEISSTAGLLTSLNYLVSERRDEAQWPKIFVPLLSANGPIDSLVRELTSLAEKLSYGRNRSVASLKWKYKAVSIRSTLIEIERTRNLLTLAMQAEHLRADQLIQEQIKEFEGIRIESVSLRLKTSALTKSKRDIEYAEVLDWLSPLNFEAIHQDISSKREQGTGHWFLESPQFERWVQGGPSTLWCPGIPGSGKTIMASLVVDHLSNLQGSDDNVGIACVYCSYRDQDQQTALNLVGAMLRQLLVKRIEKDGDISLDVLRTYERRSSGQSRPLLEELTDFLVGQLAVYERLYLIIDALDECPEGNGARGAIIDLLRTLRKIGTRCSVLVTSRIQYTFQNEFGGEGCLRLDVSANTSDVRKFIQSNIKRHWRIARAVEDDPNLQETIVADLTKKAGGMFLLANLQLKLLSGAISIKRLMESLDRLPSSLMGLYDAIMLKIGSQSPEDRAVAQEILYWVSNAKRPLTSAELQCALSLEVGSSKLDSQNSIFENDMIDLCGSLITVERATGVIRLVHYTAQEYLSSECHEFPLDLSVCVALKCLSCLSLEDCRRGPCASDTELESRLQSIPLLEYAAKYWGNHMKDSQATETIEPAVDLLQDERLLASTWQIMHIPSARYPKYSQNYPQWTSGLQLAAFFDLEGLVHRLVDCGIEIEVQDDYYGRPLHAAAAGGSLNVCRLLVLKGVDVNASGGRLDSALQAAASAGHDEVVQFLLEANANPNAQGGLYTTPLQAASLEGHIRIAQFLLKGGAMVDAQVSSGRTALHCAAMHGHLPIVELLLHEGANVDSRDNDNGRTALSWAAWNGHSETVDLLLASNADIDAVDHQNSTALHLALERHHEDIVQHLLDKGAKFDVVDASNRTQIQIALASIEKINTEEFETHDELTRALDRGSQAVVSVLRRKPEYQLHKANFEHTLKKTFSLDDASAVDIQRNLIRERQALQNLNHPNVVKYLKYEEDEDHEQAFLYTEYCDGGSLSRYCRKTSKSLDLYAAWSIVYDLAAALAYCHHGLHLDEGSSFSLKHKWQTLLHRDIKPANIVLSTIEGSRRGVPVAKLCDMGWAKIWSDPNGYQTAKVGSLRYMPKEVKEGDAWTPKGDIHSLGATLRDLKQDFEDDEFNQLVSRCTNENPSLRPSSFTLLEIAAKRLGHITGQNLKDRFLPSSHGESVYLFQAVLETLNRLFITYRAVTNLPIGEAAKRLRLLIADWDKGEADMLRRLDLKTSPQFALIFGDVEKAKILIKTGHKGSRSRWDSRGFTPLHIACREFYQDIVECWLEQKYPVDDQDDKGRSALHWAVIVGSLVLCQKLLQAGASTELQDIEGSAALHRAAESGHIEIISALLDRNANIEATNKEKATPLHRAAATGNRVCVDLLLEKGADRFAIDMEGFSPAQMASANGFEVLGQYLREVSRATNQQSYRMN